MQIAERRMQNECRYSNSAFNILHSAFGFTLIELLVVIVVIAVLAGLVGPMVFRNVGDAKVTAAKAQLELFGLALDQYRLDNDYYPSSTQGLEALRSQPSGEPAARNWRGPYLKKAVPLDPWGRLYVYKSPGDKNPTGYDLATYGRDGQPGGDGEDRDVVE
jgi:general secretion pathway protein G